MTAEVVQCGRPGKATHPERPSCEHGPMHSIGRWWGCAAKSKATSRAYYEANREKVSARKKARYEANGGEDRRRRKTYYWEDPVRGVEQSLRSRRKKAMATLTTELTAAENELLSLASELGLRMEDLIEEANRS